MARFRQVPQKFVFDKLMAFWLNMVRNYREEIRDNDFFDIICTCCDHDKAVELIEAAYTAGELEEMANAKSRRVRVDLGDSLDDLFQAIWNHEWARERCKVVLESIHDYLVGDGRRRKEEVVERRFEHIARLLRLSDLEREILVLSYIKSQQL